MLSKKSSKKLLHELAARNVRKSAEDYLIYFFTLTLAVGLFYTFNSLSEQLQALALQDTYNFLTAAESALAGCSLFVCFIIGFLILYADNFLMKRRKREFGLYGVLGMEQKDIGRMMTREAVLIGGAALFSGLLLGVAASQLLVLVTARMSGVGAEHYSFVFSVKAMGAAVLFFVVTFFAVHLFRLREVKRMVLLDLLYAERKNEEITEKGRAGILVCMVSLLLITAGYAVIFHWQNTEFFETVSLSGMLITVGTILFFLSAAPVIMKLLKRRKGFYYRGLNLFVVNQLGSRMKQERWSLAIVCVLMYLSVSVMGVGTGLGQSFIKEKENMVPYDLSVIYYYGSGRMDQRVEQGSILDEMKNRNLELTRHMGQTGEITFYQSENQSMRSLFGPDGEFGKEQKEMLSDEPVMMVGIEDYNRIRSLLGQEAVTLEDDEYAVNFNEPLAEDMLKEYTARKVPLELGRTSLSMKEGGLCRTTLYNRNVLLDMGTLIVPQHLAETGRPFMKIMDGMFQTDENSAYEAVQYALIDMASDGFSFQNRADLFIEFLSNQLMMSYLGIYLGITFLVTAGAVLALQQLSQAAGNEKRYALLYRMGAGPSAMRGALTAQLGIYFGLPFLIAAVHSGITMYGVYRGVPYLTGWDIAQNILIAAGLAVALYGVYFITTYAGCRRILKL